MALDDPFATPIPKDADPKLLEDPFADTDAVLSPGVPQNETVIQKSEPAAPKADMRVDTAQAQPAPAPVQPAPAQTAPAQQAPAQTPPAQQKQAPVGKAPAQPAQVQEQPDDNPLQGLQLNGVQKGFAKYVFGNEVNKKAWSNGSMGMRRSMLNAYIDNETQRLMTQMAKDERLRKLPKKQRKEVLRQLYRRTKARLKSELTPLVGALASNKSQLVSDPDGWATMALKKSGIPLDADGVIRKFQKDLAANPRFLEKWQGSSEAWHKTFVNKYRAKLEQEAVAAVKSKPEFKRLSAKERAAAIKAVREAVRTNADLALTTVVGQYDLQDPEKLDKLSKAADPVAAEDAGLVSGILKVAAGSAIEGAADLASAPGDFLAWLTDDPTMRDIGVFQSARGIAEYGAKLREQGIPEKTRIKLQQMQDAINNSQYGTVASIAADPDVIAVLGAQSLGYILGSGGVAGGARVAAGRALTALTTTKSVGAALRSARAANLGTAAGVGAATGAQQGRQVTDQIMNMDTTSLKATPAWAMMSRKLARHLGRAPVDEEVKLALANLAASRASVHGAAVSTAATLFLGGFTEKAFGQLPFRAASELFGKASVKATTATSGLVKAGTREAASEFVEEAGQQLASNLAVQSVTGQGDAMQGVVGSGIAGAVLGGLMGGGLGAISGYQAGRNGGTNQDRGGTPPASPDDGGESPVQTMARVKTEAAIANDPDIQAAKEEAAAINVEAERIAAKAAGKDGDVVTQATGVEGDTIDGIAARDALINGPFRIRPGQTIELGTKQKRVLQPFYDDAAADHTYLVDDDGNFYKYSKTKKRLTRITERMSKELEHATILYGAWADMYGEQDKVSLKSAEAIQTPLPEDADLVTEPEEIVPGDEELNAMPEPEPVTEEVQPDPNIDIADQVRAYVHMLVKSGEPEALALRSASKTFGARAIPDDILQTYKDVDPADLRQYLEGEGAPRATSEHVMRVQKALGPGIKAHVVASGADMPGMGLHVPVATFRINGGADSFTVVNAGAIKQPGRARALVMAHDIMRHALDRNTNELLFKAAQVAAEKYGAGFTDTRGIVMDPERVTALKNPKTKTADQIISQFQDRLMMGDETALKSLRRALEAADVKVPKYMSNAQFWRVLMETGIIPETEYAKTVSAPFGSIAPEVVIPPKGSEDMKAGMEQDVRRTVGEGGGGDKGPANPGPNGTGEGNNDADGNDLTAHPPQLVVNGMFRIALNFGDGMGLLTALQGALDSEGVPEGVRNAGYEFINAMRSMRARINETNQLRSSVVYDINNMLKEIARTTGDTVEATRRRLNDYLAALHAKERNATLWTTLVPLQDREAAQQRQALMDRILSGQGGPDTMRELTRIVENGQPAVLRKDAVYGGMTDAEADSIINAAKARGLDKLFEPAVQHVQHMAELIKRWRKESGVYAGPAGHVVDAYDWKYYVPLRDTPETTDFDYKMESESVVRMTRPVVAKKKAPAGGRIKLEKVDILTNLELEMRDAAYAAALANPVKAAAKFANAGDWTVKIGKTSEVGAIKYHTGDDNRAPGWELPEIGSSNPKQFAYFDDATGSWHRLVVFDNKLASYLRNQYDSGFMRGGLFDKIAAKVGNITRLYARGYTTLNPGFLFTAWMRDLVNTTVVSATQKGLNPAKVSGRIIARTASMFGGKYFSNMYKFMAANALEREQLANDPDFRSQPGMDLMIERWRNGGFITFSDQLDPATGERFHIIPKPFRKMAERIGAQKVMITMEHISSVLDNIHRQVVYDTMRESGAPASEATLYTRQIMDFNRFSEWGRQLNNLWIFAQSGMTGVNTLLTNYIWKNGSPPMKTEMRNGNIVFTLDETRVSSALNRGAIGFFIISGAASTVIAATLMGNDDDGEPVAKSIQPGTWLNYHILPFNVGWMKDAGLEVPIKLPRQYGLQQIFEGLGSLLALKAMGLADDRELMFAAATHLAANLVPVGRLTFPQNLEGGAPFDAAEFGKQLAVNYSPTVTQALTEVTLNRNTFGGNVHKTKSFGDTGVNAYRDQFIGTPVVYQEIAEFMKDAIGLNVYPESIEVLIRDGLPILGPVVANLQRTAVSLMSRPDRTVLESILGSTITPTPGLAYDVKYDYIRQANRINTKYLKVADAEFQDASQTINPAERSRLLSRFYRRYPWYKAVKSVRRSYSERMKKLRADVIDARKKAEYERAETLWRRYIALQRERLGKTIDIMRAHGVDPLK